MYGAEIPAGAKYADVGVKIPKGAAKKVFKMSVAGKADFPHGSIVRESVPCEDMMQAFYYRHYVPAAGMWGSVNSWNIFGRGFDAIRPDISKVATPIKIKKGESPIKSNGKLLVIDGGLSKAYQKVTGLAGYTLLFNSHGLLLSAHDAFESIESAIKEEKDIHSTLDVVELAPNRLLVEDTDAGKSLSKKITDLKALVDAYLKGKIKTH